MFGDFEAFSAATFAVNKLCGAKFDQRLTFFKKARMSLYVFESWLVGGGFHYRVSTLEEVS